MNRIKKKIHQKTLIYDCKLCDMPAKIALFLKNFTELCVNVDSTQTYCCARELEWKQLHFVYAGKTDEFDFSSANFSYFKWLKQILASAHTIVSFQLNSTNKGMMLACCWSLLRFLLLFSRRVLLEIIGTLKLGKSAIWGRLYTT